jgi:hypothetical protein
MTFHSLLHSHVETLLASRALPRSKTIIFTVRYRLFDVFTATHCIYMLYKTRYTEQEWRSSAFIVYTAESLRCRHSTGGHFGATLQVAFCNVSYSVRPPSPPPLRPSLCTQPLETLIKSSLHHPTPSQPFCSHGRQSDSKCRSTLLVLDLYQRRICLTLGNGTIKP